jgi:predicted Zn-dependent peptidase
LPEGRTYIKMNNPQFKKTTMSDGLRVLTERHDHVPSATIGLWIEAGSVFERDDEDGLSHLLEHMVFKGTARRNASQIAAAMDAVGGQLNAFTERELVCFHARVLAEHAPLALELLCDFVTCPTLSAHDLEIEKGVILEEIKSVEDAPEELVEELFQQTIWPDSIWGRSILGNPKCVEKFSSRDVRSYLSTHYAPRHVLVAAVGNVEHDDIVQRATTLLQSLPGINLRNRDGGDQSSHRAPRAPKIKTGRAVVQRECEQVHLVAGTRGFDYRDEKRFAGWLLDAILTGGYSSRLFQEIREKRGLCYAISSFGASYRAASFWSVETSVAPESAEKVLELIGRELKKFKAKGASKSELQRAKDMMRAGILLSEESSSSQMSRIARNELYYGRQRSTEEVLADVLKVSLAEVQSAANEIFDPKAMNLAAIGPIGDLSTVLPFEVS